MGEDVIKIKDYKPKSVTKQATKESDLAMFSILWFKEHFEELLSYLDNEVRYALIISAYRYMVDAEKAGDIQISLEGFSINSETSKELQDKIKDAIDWQPSQLN